MAEAGSANEALPRGDFNASVLAYGPNRVAALIAPLLRREMTGITIRQHACPETTVEDVMRAFIKDVMPLVAQRPIVA